jgi:K+-transporting ATPase ATPase C chain
MRTVLTVLRLFLVMTVLTGFLYPLAVTGIVQTLFPHRANGSMTTVNGVQKGSEWVGQEFISGRYFWSRPSAIHNNPIPSGGTNLGPTSHTLQASVRQRRSYVDSTNTARPEGKIPGDMLFSSASGIDPHISPEAARLQIDRVARARGFTKEQMTKLAVLVERSVEPPQWGILGEPRVNVFLLNIALDRLK